MKIVLLEPLSVSEDKLAALAETLTGAGHEFVSYGTVASDASEMLERAKDADVLMIANHPLPGEVIRQCSNLKYISVAFVGIDHIDTKACQEKGIHISNAAGYCDDAVAELALGLALDCLRNITAVDGVARKGGMKAGLVGHELKGKTVGIIGTGGTGCRVAELYKAFGCRLLGYSRTERQRAKDAGVSYVSLEELLKESDIVTIHTPLTEETRNLMNEERIALMKPTAVFINTARGGVADSKALAKALQEEKLGAVGTDVFETEPPLPSDTPMLHAPRTVVTPHVAFATIESLERRAEITFDNVTKWFAGVVQNQML